MSATPADAKSIFGHAMSLSAPEERAAYLQQACAGNSALQAEIESLLQADREACSFLGGREPRPIATVDDPVRERPSSVVGPYKLVEQIGEGGMGTVWMAQQTEPVKRLVALKVIKPGMDSRQVIARFEAERQAVKLDPSCAKAHNNLAWLLLAGPKELRDPAQALPLARKAVELEPKNAIILNTLGVALYYTGHFAEAIPALERSLGEQNGQADAFDLFFLAMCHHRQGDAAKAKECLQRGKEWFEKRAKSAHYLG